MNRPEELSPQLNWLRRRLHDVSDPLAISLADEFAMVESISRQTWIPALGPDKGSHSGVMHLQGVESQICGLLEKSNVQFSVVECFILLTAILAHDLGRTLSQKDVETLISQPNHDEFELHKEFKSNKHHALVSAYFILQENPHYHIGIRDLGLAKCVALVCASHYQPAAKHFRSKGFLEDRFLDRFGKIRIGWLACLLALGDELDDSYHRVSPDWIRTNIDRDDIKEIIKSKCHDGVLPKDCPVSLLLNDDIRGKGSARIQRTGCEVNLKGHLLVLHGQDDIYNKLTRKVADDDLDGIISDLIHKKDLICFWGPELRQLHLELMNVALSVKGHLFGPSNPVQKGAKSKASDLRLIVEPVIRQMKIDRIMDAACNLRFGSYGKTAFPWETLATEAGIESPEELRLIFHRLLMLSLFFNSYPEEKELKITMPTRPSVPLAIHFIELDGEWAIQLMAQNCESPSDDDIRSTLSGFRDWVAEIICGTPAYQMPYCSSLKINNNDLAFVLDELESVKGIMFPASTSLIIKKESEPRMGINLVISGPPGVGKSTLAMELAMRCKPWIKGIIDGGIIRSISAYYSLEQPRETIRSLANDIGIKNDSIVDLFLDPIIENHDNALESSYVEIYKSLIKRNPKSLLLLPILSPRAFVGNQEEERLYWFRYKQIARLLEAARYTSANDAMLTTVVLDNLNAFARHALARQRIHQLFSNCLAN